MTSIEFPKARPERAFCCLGQAAARYHRPAAPSRDSDLPVLKTANSKKPKPATLIPQMVDLACMCSRTERQGDLDQALELFTLGSGCLSLVEKGDVLTKIRKQIVDGRARPRALVPFIACDISAPVVGGAVRSLILGTEPLEEGGAPVGLAIVDNLVAAGGVQSLGGVLAGILGCGDLRLHDIAMKTASSCTIKDVVEAAQCGAAPVTVAAFGFWATLAEQSHEVGPKPDLQVYSAACAALIKLKRVGSGHEVFDYEHTWGCWQPFASAKVIERGSFDGFRDLVAGRLVRIAVNAKSHRLMDPVLEEWGIRLQA